MSKMHEHEGVGGEESAGEVTRQDLREEVEGLKLETKTHERQCHWCRTAGLYSTLLAVVVIVGVVLWNVQTSTNQELKDQLAQMETKLQGLENSKQQKQWNVQQLSNELIKTKEELKQLKKRQQSEHKSFSEQISKVKERTEKTQQGVTNKTKETIPNPPNNRDNSTGYTINTNIRQEEGTRPQLDGTVQAIELLATNHLNQTIDQVLYTPELRKARELVQAQRITFMKKYANFESIHQSLFNMKLNKDNDEVEARQLKAQYERVSKVHKLAQFNSELPMCILTPSYRNNAQFRIQYNLNSIFTQNYSNYYAVIVNDVSDDGSDKTYRDYFSFYQIPSSKYIYINNTQKKGAMQNDYIANHQYCSKDAISVQLDGDDEFIGRNVLKIFNAEYQRTKAGALYSNFYFYRHNSWANVGFTSDYPLNIKSSNSYRSFGMRFSHLKTYRTQLFRGIDKSNFIDSKGNFFQFASDVAFYIPIMEVSCGRVHKIAGFHYLYHTGTGNNEDTISRAKQIAADREVRTKKKLTCNEGWKKRMGDKP